MQRPAGSSPVRRRRCGGAGTAAGEATRVKGRLAVARRGRRIGIAFTVVFVVLATLVVIGDRVAASTAEREIAKQAVKEMHARGITSPMEPTAKIGGFPFLTQVARGRYDKVTIEVDQPRTDVVRLSHLTLVATAVRALLNFAGLSGVDPKAVQLSVVDDNVRLRIPLVVVGQEFVVLATAKLAVASGVVRLQVTGVALENGSIPGFLQGIINALKQRLQVAIQVPAMPYKLTIKWCSPADRR